jgi:fatty-acyl-CoA synthase
MSTYPDRPFQLGLINDALTDAVGDRVAIIQGDRRVTYRELGERSRQIAHLFVERGIGCHGDHDAMQAWESCQDHVAICMLNRPEYMAALLGSFKARAVPFNVNYRYTPSEVADLLRGLDTKVVVYEDRFADLINEAVRGIDSIELLLNVDADAALIDAQPTTRLDLPYSADDIYIICTGGTTGPPKGVMWPQERLFLLTLTGQLPGEERPKTMSDVIERAKGMGGLVSMICPPLMHGAGQWGTLNFLHQGATVVYAPNPESFDAASVLESMQREGVISLQIAGDAFAIPIVDAFRKGNYDITLLAISTTAVALTENTRRDLHELFPHALIVESYGSTEGGMQAYRQGGAADDDAETSTFKAANSSVIVDESKTRLLDPSDVGVIGWLARSGPQPRGYYGDKEKTQDTFLEIDGEKYVVTGDRGHYLEDGTIRFLGREAVCINSGGEKIFAEEVESALKSHPAVVDALVFGIPDERFGERVTAVISTRDGVDDAELDQHQRSAIAGYKIARTIIRTEQVPRMANGKPDYAGARQLALEEVS